MTMELEPQVSPEHVLLQQELWKELKNDPVRIQKLLELIEEEEWDYQEACKKWRQEHPYDWFSEYGVGDSNHGNEDV